MVAYTQTVESVSPTATGTAGHTATGVAAPATIPATSTTGHTAPSAPVTDVALEKGVVIPGVFIPVDVVVKDEEGNRLPEVKWVMSAGIFPTAAPVDDNAEATLRLLGTVYESFMCIAEDDTPKTAFIDYAWYSTSDQQEPIAPLTQDTGEIIVTPERVELSTGLDMSGEVRFG